MLVVETKEELKRAREQNVAEFMVVGDLAEKLYKSKGIKKLSKKKIIALSGLVSSSLVISPVTGGVSLGVASATAVGLTGLSAATIISIVSIGSVVAVYGMHKDYDVEVEAELPRKVKMRSTKSA